MNASIKSFHSNQTNLTNFFTKILGVTLRRYIATSKTSPATSTSALLTENINCGTLTINTDQRSNQIAYNNHDQFPRPNEQFPNENQCSHITITRFDINQNNLTVITVNRNELCETCAEINETRALTSTVQSAAKSVRKTLTYRKVWKCFYCVSNEIFESHACYDSYNSCEAAKCVKKCKKFKTARANLCETSKTERRR